MPKRKTRIKHIRAIFDSPYTLSKKKTLSAFLDAYILCEALAHKLIAYHHKDTGRHYEGKTLHINILKSALNFYRVDSDDTDAVFSTHRRYNLSLTLLIDKNRSMALFKPFDRFSICSV